MQDVTIVRWPEERSKREELARSGRPRLLLVEDSAAPPVASDALEDWVRQPCSDLDLRARVEGLRRRLEPVRLAIRTVRSRGYLLEPAAVADAR